MKQLIITLVVLLFVGNGAYAQKKLKIGDTEYVFQLPFKVNSNADDSLRANYNLKNYKGDGKRFQRHISDFYIGMGFMCPLGNETYQPVYFGNSFNLEIGWKYIYRPARWYGIGTMLQYSAYSYKLKTNGEDVFDLGIATTGGNQYYRTDNLGTGIVNRFYLFPSKYYSAKRQVFIELCAWGDYSYSKRLKIKDFSSDSKEKYKYRDGSKFNPFQAGVQGGIGYRGFYVYGKYRLTDNFNHREVSVAEMDRFSIGVQLYF